MDDFAQLDVNEILGQPGVQSVSSDPFQSLDFDSILGPSPKSQAKAAVVSAPDVAPDQAARQVTLGSQIGLPPQVVDPKQAQDQLHAKAAAAVIDAHPEVADYVNSVPMAAQVSKDDFANLGFFASAAKLLGSMPDPDVTAAQGLPNVPGEIAEGAAQGFAAQNYARNASKFWLGDKSVEPTLEAYESQPHEEGGFLQKLGSFLGMTASSVSASGPAVLAGASVGGFAAGPAGAAAGAVTGIGAGVAADFMLSSAGQQYRALGLARDRFGAPLPEGIRQVGAVATGLATAGVMALAGPEASKLVGPIVGDAFARALGDKVAQASVAQAVGNLAKAGIGGGAINLGMTLAQSAVDQAAKVYSGQDFKTVLNDPATLGKFASDAASAFVDGALLFGGLHLPGIGMNILADRARVEQTRSDAANIDRAVEAAQGSQTLQRAPEMFRELAARVAPGDVNISAVKLAEIRAADPKAFDYVPDIDVKVAEAASRGGDVAIPKADYFTSTDPKLHELVKDDIRSDTGLTRAEAEELGKREPESYEAHTETAYHGSQNVIEDFDPNKTQVHRDVDGQDLGALYFATDPKLAEQFSVGTKDGDPVRMVEDEDFLPAMKKLAPSGEWFKDLKSKYDAFEELRVKDPEDNRLANMARDLNKLAQEVSSFTGGEEVKATNAPNTTRVRLDPGKQLLVDMSGRFDWDIEKNALKQAKAEGYDSIRMVNHGNPGDIISVFDPKRVVNDLQAYATEHNLSPLEVPIFDKAAAAVEKERASLFLGPIILPEAAGLNKTDFARYSRHIQEMQRKIEKSVFDAVHTEVRRRESRQWKTEAAFVAGQVEKDLRARPDWNAEQRLRGQGEYEGLRGKLDKDSVNELYSAQEQTALGASPADLLQRDIVGRGGFDPAAMAQLSGHDSARAMVDDLIRLESERRANGETPAVQFARQLKEETQARMEAKYGSVDETALREAVDAVMSVQQLEVLRDDFKRIADASGTPFEPLTRAELEAWARDRIGDMPHKQAMRTEDFRRVIARAGAAAEKALLAGKYDEAFQAKQLQMQNFLLARESARVAKDSAYVGKQMDRLSKNKVIDSWDQEFTDAGHGLLQELGIVIPRSEENLRDALVKRDDGRPMDFTDWAQTKSQREGVDVVPPPDGLPRDASKLTSDQVAELKKTFQSLDYHARLAKKIMVGEKLEEFNAVKEQIHDNLIERATRFDKNDKSTWADLRSVGRQIDAQQIRMEQFMLWLDKNDPNGVMTQTVIRPLKEGQYTKDDLVNSVSKDMASLPGDKAWRKSWNQDVPNSVLLDSDGTPMKLTRGKLVSIILNMGNEVNLAKLVKGHGWDEGTLRRWVWENARKEDYDFAQAMWDRLEKLWPTIAEKSKAATGVATERTKAKALDTPHGRYAGGYFPLLRDYDKAPITAKGDLMEQGWTSPFVTEASSTKARTGAVYPLALDLDQLPGRLQELIHNLAYAEPVRNAAKILRDKDIQKIIGEKYGPEYRDLLIPWLQNIAQNGGRYDSRGAQWLAGKTALLRQNAVFMLVGYRGSTALIHGGAALMNSIGEVGLKGMIGAAKDLAFAKPNDVLSAADQIYRNPQNLKSMWNWAMQESGELRNRQHNLDADIAKMLDQSTLGRGVTWRERNIAWSMKLVSTLDIMSAVPTWMAEFKSARMSGLEHEDAVFQADQAVRQAHGSSALMDLPEIQRNKNFKFLTMFLGYFNHNYNRLRNLGREAAEIPGADNPLSKTGHIALQSVAYLLAPALIHAVVRGHGPGDEENPFVWGLKAMGIQIGSSMVGVREIINAWQIGQKASAAGPLSEMLSGLAAPFSDMYKASQGKATPKAAQHAIELPGWVMGFPFPRSVAGVGQYAWDEANDNGRSDVSYFRLLADGNPAPFKAHH